MTKLIAGLTDFSLVTYSAITSYIRNIIIKKKIHCRWSMANMIFDLPCNFNIAFIC